MTAALTVLLVLALSIAAVIGWCGVVEANRHTQLANAANKILRRERDRAAAEAIRFQGLYHDSVAERAALSEFIGGEDAAQVAATEAKRLDDELFELLAEEGQ